MPYNEFHFKQTGDNFKRMMLAADPHHLETCFDSRRPLRQYTPTIFKHTMRKRHFSNKLFTIQMRLAGL